MLAVLSKVKDQKIKHDLIYSALDGVAWAMMFGLAENYMVPFALLFGASVLQISLLQGFAQLGTGVGQLLGGQIILHYQKRKRMAITSNIFQASSWLFVFFLTVWTKNPWFAVAFYALGVTASNFGGPGWLSWMSDLIPVKIRGEYWGVRNRIMGIAQFAAILLAGLLLFYSKKSGFEIPAYGILFVLGFGFRFSSFYFLGKQRELPMHVTAESHSFKFPSFVLKLPKTNFGRFAIFSFLLNFSLVIINPLIPVFLLQNLGFNYLQFTAVMMASVISQYIFMSYWGPLSDKYGNYRILIMASAGVPLVAVGWVFITNFYLLILLQLFSGFAVSGINLATNNYIFDAVKRENMPKVISYFNTLNTFFAFLGAVLGGVLVSLGDNLVNLIQKENGFILFHSAFTVVFALAAVLRLIVLAVFRKQFQEVREAEKSPAIHYFYIYKPAQDMLNFIGQVNDRIQQRVRSFDPKQKNK